MDLRVFYINFLVFLKSNLVSLAGLAVGMMVTVLSITYIVFESSYDSFHSDSERIYQVSTQMERQPGNEVVMSNTHQQLKEYIDLHVPQVEITCRIKSINDPIYLDQDKFRGHRGLFIDREFFEIFNFTMLIGDANSIVEPNTIILTRDLAEKLFGDIDCQGKTLIIKDNIYTVAGIANKPPGNSSIKFDYLIPLANFFNSLPPLYNFVSVETYIKSVLEFEDINEISGLLDEFYEVYDVKSKEMFSTKVGKLSDIHQYFYKTSKNYILFVTISLLVLIVSVVNFMNTFAAAKELRIKEIGIRKVFGASRVILIRSMLLQSVILTLLSAILGIILSEIFMDTFRTLSGVDVSQYGPGLWWIQVLIVLIAIISGLLAGIVPSFRYSSSDVISLIRASAGLRGGSLTIRKILITGQYLISAGLLICIIIFFFQIRYLGKKDPGYISSNRILIEVSPALEFKYNTYIGELRKIPGIKSISGNGSAFGQTVGMGIRKEKEGEGLTTMGYFVEDDFFKTYGIEVLAGKTFSQTSEVDTGKVIIDKATAEIFGFDDPVGKKIYTSSLTELEIMGVVENSDLIARKGERDPFLYTQFFDICAELIINYQGDAATVAREVADRMLEFDPEFEYNYRTVDEARKTLYEVETNQLKIVLFVGIIAILLTLVGAYSMASYMAERRAKQVSIRKVMGATVSEVLQLSIREIVLMVIIAFMLASPLAYLVSSRWLQNFTQKINIGILPFLLSLVCILVLVFLTAFFKERQSAMANPVDNLRQE
ncbi:MAG: ABC transporter permease [Marinilabiliaceae bacterium]|jgi:putative ABC transport system permease protein|nr:ABC transporter permease [Marinilabiliaceae bacterium]